MQQNSDNTYISTVQDQNEPNRGQDTFVSDNVHDPEAGPKPNRKQRRAQNARFQKIMRKMMRDQYVKSAAKARRLAARQMREATPENEASAT